MTIPLSRISAVLLALVIVVTSVSMAVARVGMSVHGTAVLCIGSEAVTVLMGADGRPLEARHICPDCTMGDLADITTPSGTGLPTDGIALHAAALAWDAPALSALPATARAPPMHLL